MSNEREAATYSEVLGRAEALRPLLGSCRQPPLVLSLLPSGPTFTAVQLAGLAEGAIVVPISHQSTDREVENYLDLIQPDLVVAESLLSSRSLLAVSTKPTTVLVEEQEGEELAGEHQIIDWGDLVKRDFRPLDPETRDLPSTTALIYFTSGSTGTPKGILLSTTNISSYLENNREFLERFSGQHVFCPMPQFHAFGGTVALEHVLSAAPIHLANTFMPGEHLDRMDRFNCSSILAAPSYFRMLLQMDALSQKRLKNLSSVSMGSATIDPPLTDVLHSSFDDLEIHLRYGLTETMGPVCRLSLSPGEKLDSHGLVGTPVPGVELAEGPSFPNLGDLSEVRVRSKIVAEGQLLGRDCWKPLAAEDGFFSTGDLGYLDERGRLHLRGRISTFIKRNGFRIDPLEIEALLRSQPGVREAAVIGVPDPVAGEQVVSCVEVLSGRDAPSERTLMEACRRSLSATKVPQRFLLMQALPRTGSGKPDRVRLKEMIAEKPHD